MKELLEKILPERICKEVNEYSSGLILEEIRIRRGRQAYIIASGNNILLPIITHDIELQAILDEATHHSMYAYRDTINNGYIAYGSGIRIGIIGSAGSDGGVVSGIYDINELSIRIPNKIYVNCNEIVRLIKAQRSSVLIYSPPGIGKTTLLRSLIKDISSGMDALRVAVIDTRDEIACGIEEKDLLVSVLSRYPRRRGIEIAIRTMNPQYLVCDEIGDVDDASAITEAQIAGVPLIATCHGSSVSDILSHIGILTLHNARIFDYYVGITRKEKFELIFDISSWEEADDRHKAMRCC